MNKKILYYTLSLPSTILAGSYLLYQLGQAGYFSLVTASILIIFFILLLLFLFVLYVFKK